MAAQPQPILKAHDTAAAAGSGDGAVQQQPKAGGIRWDEVTIAEHDKVSGTDGGVSMSAFRPCPPSLSIYSPFLLFPRRNEEHE
jgi:hypothetical protein